MRCLFRVSGVVLSFASMVVCFELDAGAEVSPRGILGSAIGGLHQCVRQHAPATTTETAHVVLELTPSGGPPRIITLDNDLEADVEQCLREMLEGLSYPPTSGAALRSECRIPLRVGPPLLCGAVGEVPRWGTSAPAREEATAADGDVNADGELEEHVEHRSQQEDALENTAERCRDDEDNDRDGHVDCADQDCDEFVFCVESADEGDEESAESTPGGLPPLPFSGRGFARGASIAGYIFMLPVLGLGIAAEVTNGELLPALPLGGAAFLVGTIITPIVAGGAFSTKRAAGVRGCVGCAVVSWIFYGLSAANAAVLIGLGATNSIEIPTGPISVSTGLGALSMLLMSIHAGRAARQAEEREREERRELGEDEDHDDDTPEEEPERHWYSRRDSSARAHVAPFGSVLTAGGEPRGALFGLSFVL